ncbi:MAG: HD domain-containing protein [Coriobacteriia bacterium]|nr:HD domain-containing protein [Coriobacteriia bacterium]
MWGSDVGSETSSSKHPASDHRPRGPAAAALPIVLTYAVVAFAWILFSDAAVRLVSVDPDVMTQLASFKGTLFVLVTSALLFFQMRRSFARLEATSRRLSESEQRFRRVVDVSPVAMAMNDADGTVTLTNAAFANLIGYTADDIPTLSDWWEKAYPDAVYRAQVADAWRTEVDRSGRAGEPFSPLETRIRCKDGTERFMLVGSAGLDAEGSERVVVFFDLTDREDSEQSLVLSNERLNQVLKSVIALIGSVVEARDPYTRGHEEGVARLGRLIAEEMGLSADEVDWIEVAGLVHDVGKLGVPSEILTKPGKITSLEYELIQSHPQLGYDILKAVDFGWPVAETVLQHHERMDGSGYPGGLVAEDISVPARVLMVADVIEAMAAHRPYRPALGVDAAVEEIRSHPEKFDAPVIAACVRLFDEGRIAV